MAPTDEHDLLDSGDWPSDHGEPERAPDLALSDGSELKDQGEDAQPEDPIEEAPEEFEEDAGSDEPDRLHDVLHGGPLQAYRVPGSVLGPYRIEAEIARGGMGRIYRAKHRDLERTVALKVILAGTEATPVQRERFLREATMGAGLLHPGIVRVHDYGDEDGLAYLALEYVPGPTLHSRMSELSRDALLEVLVKVGDALGHAHEAGVIHRDLKPPNILLRQDGSPVVTDFGLARDLGVSSGLTKSGAALGTPVYMAPEQTRGGTPSPATDVFGLGVLLYQGLTGKLPFDGDTVSQLYVQINALDPPSPSKLDRSIPPAVSNVCLRALAKRPVDRFVDGADFARALDAARRGEGVRRPATLESILLGGALLLVFGVLIGIVSSIPTRPTNGVATPTTSTHTTLEERPSGSILLALSDPIPRAKDVRYRDGGRFEGLGWISVHGLEPKELKQEHEALTKRGFGLDSVGVNTQTRVPRFAGVWRRDDGLERRGFIDISQIDYSREWHTLKDQGWRPTRMIRWTAESDRFLGTWVSGGTEPWRTLPALPLKEARSRHAVAHRQGMRVESLAATPGPEPTFSIVWVDDGRLGRVAFSLDRESFGRWLADISAEGFRPTLIQAHGRASAPRFAGVAVKDDRPALTFHGLQPAEYQHAAEVLVRSGYQPVSIAEYGVRRAQRRISSCWVSDPSPAIWRVTGPEVPRLAAVDEQMRASMQSRGVSAGALAIVQAGRLVFARGYTLAPSSQSPTLPTTAFRLGDLSQPITAVGVLRLVEEGNLELDQTLGTLFPEIESAGDYADPRLGRVTVRQLLAHRGGWDREGVRSRYDPRRGYQLFDPTTFNDRVVAAELEVPLPITSAQRMELMNRHPLEFEPGSRFVRSSYGYVILGRIIEVLTGRSYAGAMKTEVLARLGPTRLEVGDGRLARRLPGEAIHESRLLWPDVFGEGTVVPAHYGGQNLHAMAAHAGWVGSVVDVARFLAALSDPTHSPLLRESSIRTMWTAPGDGYALGWEVSGTADDPLASADGGRRPGSWGHMERGPGGVSFVVLFNRQAPDPALVGGLRATLRKVEDWPTLDLFGR